jgi:predicted dehydrogenase/nucleoside-diphosphate-sugar epimerase
MKIALLGAGHIASLHASAIERHPDAHIVAIGDRDRPRATALAKHVGGAEVFEDPLAVLEHAKPEVVHVVVPPHDHARLAVAALRHGCHVYVEKPMALTVADAEEMIAVAREQRVSLCVGHNLLFDQTVSRAVQLVEQGAIGHVVSVEACYMFDPRRYPAILEEGAEHCHWSYRLPGGPLQDLMPHMGALLCRFLSELEEVHAVVQNRGVLPNGWPDEVRVLVKSSTALGVLGISLSERPDTISLTLKGTSGTVHADLFKNLVTLEQRSDLLPRAVARGLAGFGSAAQVLRGALGNVVDVARGRMDKTSGLSSLVSRFYAGIRDGSGPPVSLEESRRVVDLTARVWPEPGALGRRRPAMRSSTLGAGAAALVTGATGFIGSHLVERLRAEGIGVRALVRRNSIHAGRLAALDVEIVEGDLSEPDIVHRAARGVQRVYHVGASMSRSWADHREATIGGTEHLLQAAVDAGVERFVHLSTLAVYDLARARPGTVITEEHPYQVRPAEMGPYAHAKIQAEQLVVAARERDGLPATIVRPGIVIGPRGRVFFPHLGYRVGARLFIVPGSAAVPLPLTAVESTVDGIYRASVIPAAAGGTYNLVDDGEVTIADYLAQLIAVTGSDAKVVVLPYAMPYLATAGYELAARVGLVPRGITSRRQLRWKRAPVRFDTTKARTELGWTPALPLHEALVRTFTWYAGHYGTR